MLQGLLKRFRHKAGLPIEPIFAVKADGFTASMEKKQGVLLHYTPKEGAPQNAEKQPASVNHYWEITFRPSGGDKEYPAGDKDCKARFTLGLDAGYGFSGGVNYIRKGANFTKFELVEEYDDGKTIPMGKRMPAHHHVGIRAYYTDVDGRETSMYVGYFVRESERNSPAWQAALRSPVHYF